MPKIDAWAVLVVLGSVRGVTFVHIIARLSGCHKHGAFFIAFSSTVKAVLYIVVEALAPTSTMIPLSMSLAKIQRQARKMAVWLLPYSPALPGILLCFYIDLALLLPSPDASRTLLNSK